MQHFPSIKHVFSFFGKTIENVRKRKNITIVANNLQHVLQTSKSNFERFVIFDEEMVGLELARTEDVLDKLIYLGAIILELVKVKMHQFWYNVLKEKYPDVQLCFIGKDFYMLVAEADYNICHVLKQDGLNNVYNRFRF